MNAAIKWRYYECMLLEINSNVFNSFLGDSLNMLVSSMVTFVQSKDN